MGWIICGVVLPSCLVAAWLIVRAPLRQILDEMRVGRAHVRFRQQREWLEVRFLKALGTLDPVERLRWEDARWHDDVHWARDSQTRRLLALVEIRFGADPFDDYATALFEYRKGRWVADGKRLDATRPDDAFRRLCRFQPVAPPQRRP